LIAADLPVAGHKQNRFEEVGIRYLPISWNQVIDRAAVVVTTES